MTETRTDTRHEIRAAMSHVPYSGSITLPGTYRDALTDEQIRAWITDLASVLRAVAERHDADHAELTTLRTQRNAMRVFLGTDRKGH